MKLTVHTCLVVCFVLLANALRQSTLLVMLGRHMCPWVE